MQLFVNLLASMNRTPGSGREGGCLKFKTRFGNGNIRQPSATASATATAPNLEMPKKHHGCCMEQQKNAKG